ncbi:MAG: hypothetical protein Kow00129_07090 [Thermoleophilia bacterium]
MIFSTTTLGLVGAVLGIAAGLAIAIFDLGGLTAAGSDSTGNTIGLLSVLLGLVALAGVAVGDRHHTLARGLFLFSGLAGFLAAAVLWIPAGLLLVLAGLTGVLTKPE